VQISAGEATHTNEDGFIDIVDGLYSIRTIPALVSRTPDQLPSATHLLLGVKQINDMDIKQIRPPSQTTAASRSTRPYNAV
jgi:hypothetical protein